MADNNELPRLPNTGWRSDDGFTQTPRAGDESTPASASEDPSSSVVAPTPHLGTDTPSSTGPETPVAGHHPPSGGVPARHPGAQTPPAGRDTPVVGHHSSYGGVPARHPGAPTPLAGPNTPVVGRATSFAGPPAHNPGGQAAGYDMSVVGQSPSFSGYPVHNTQVYGPSSTGAQGYSSFMGPAYGHSPSQFEPASHRGAPFNHGQPIPSMRQDQPSYGESVQMHGNMLSQQDVQTHDPYPWEDSPHSNIEDIQAQHRIYRFRSEHAFQRRDVPPPAHRSTSMITDDDEFLSPSAEPRMPILARPRHMSGVTYDPFVHEQPGPPRQGLFTTRPRRELQQPRATTTPRRRVRNNSPTAEEQGPSKRTRRRINEGLSASPHDNISGEPMGKSSDDEDGPYQSGLQGLKKELGIDDASSRRKSNRGRNRKEPPSLLHRSQRGVTYHLCEFIQPCKMTPSPDGMHHRKVVSHIFGRNKASTKLFPDDVWVHYCRKHYQRARYRADQWPFTQCELILESLRRMEAWGGVASFELTLRRREAIRVEEEQDDAASGSGSRRRASAPAIRRSPLPTGRKHPTAVISPVPEWLRSQVGPGMSFQQIRDLVLRVREEMDSQRTAEKRKREEKMGKVTPAGESMGTTAGPKGGWKGKKAAASKLHLSQVRFPDVEILPTFRPWVYAEAAARQQREGRGEEEEAEAEEEPQPGQDDEEEEE